MAISIPNKSVELTTELDGIQISQVIIKGRNDCKAYCACECYITYDGNSKSRWRLENCTKAKQEYEKIKSEFPSEKFDITHKSVESSNAKIIFNITPRVDTILPLEQSLLNRLKDIAETANSLKDENISMKKDVEKYNKIKNITREVPDEKSR